MGGCKASCYSAVTFQSGQDIPGRETPPTRRTETLPTAAGGPPATMDSMTRTGYPTYLRGSRTSAFFSARAARCISTPCACAKLGSAGRNHSPTSRNCCAMDSKLLLVFNLICGLRLGQTFPSLSFGGKNVIIPNHGYVDLGMVGTMYSNSVWCRTDLTTCCRSSDGTYHGQWYFPDGQHLQAIGDIYEEKNL